MGPSTQIVYTLAPKYLYRDYFQTKVLVHGPLNPIDSLKEPYYGTLKGILKGTLFVYMDPSGIFLNSGVVKSPGLAAAELCWLHGASVGLTSKSRSEKKGFGFRV